jgi:hypothetical protein
VILRCLATDAAMRFADCDELADALRDEANGDLPRSRAPGPRGRTHRMVPAFAIGAIAVAVASIALALHYLPHADERAAATVAPAAAVQGRAAPATTTDATTAAPRSAPATEAAPTHFQVALSSSPPAAQLFLGDVSLGVAPTLAEIPIGTEPVSIVARFPDGTEVVHTLVPDRPVAHIAFTKPGTRPVKRPRASRRTRRASSQPASRRGTGRSSGAVRAAAPCRCDR